MASFRGRCIGIAEKPVQWPDCLRSEAVNYLRLGHILKPLLSMLRRLSATAPAIEQVDRSRHTSVSDLG